jgi:hypothetical protein
MTIVFFKNIPPFRQTYKEVSYKGSPIKRPQQTNKTLSKVETRPQEALLAIKPLNLYFDKILSPSMFSVNQDFKDPSRWILTEHLFLVKNNNGYMPVTPPIGWTR